MRKYRERPPKGGVTDELIKADLMRVYEMHGTINNPLYRKEGKYSWSLLQQRFGSWNRALICNGIPTRYKTKPIILEDEEGEFIPIVKPSPHKCPRCQKMHVAINYICPKCKGMSEADIFGRRLDVADGWEVVAAE